MTIKAVVDEIKKKAKYPVLAKFENGLVLLVLDSHGTSVVLCKGNSQYEPGTQDKWSGAEQYRLDGSITLTNE